MIEFLTGLGVLLSGAACCGVVAMLIDHSRRHAQHETKFELLERKGVL